MTSMSYIVNYVIIATFKSKTIGKLIHRMPGLRLLISSLPAEPRNSTSFLKAMPGKFDIKTPNILYLKIGNN